MVNPPAKANKIVPTIDAHQHFWDLEEHFDYRWLSKPEHKKIHHSFLPEHLKPHLDEAGIQYSIFVQTQHTVEENRWALRLAEENPYIAGVVGWVNLIGLDCEEQVIRFKEQYPQFIGVRHITQDEPDDNFILREDVLAGLKILEKHQVPFDLLFYVKHLKHVTRLVKHCPNLKMVIDHLAKPEVKAQRLSNWRVNFRLASTFPNVYCKISGLVTEADWANWRRSDLRPFIDLALECFGPDRCMYGSDWPVCELAGTYAEVHAAARECLSKLSSAEQAAIFGGTAQKFYGLTDVHLG